MSKLFDTLVAGGITIIPLMVCSFLVIALAIERSIFWSQDRKNQKRVVRTALQIYQEDPAQSEEFLQQHGDLAPAFI
jgi:biopolymer transport protein ExbB